MSKGNFSSLIIRTFSPNRSTSLKIVLLLIELFEIGVEFIEVGMPLGHLQIQRFQDLDHVFETFDFLRVKSVFVGFHITS